MKILALGDVTGSEAVDYLRKKLPKFILDNEIDFTVVNGENSAKANGIDPLSAEALIDAGADVITTGNHVFRINAVYNYLDDSGRVIRPANLPGECPGKGYTIAPTPFGRVLVANLLGQAFMDGADNPFNIMDSILKRENGNYDVSVLDIHAESTSEKAAVARYLDGRVDVVFGTHTHVQTNDARTLPRGTGFVTDIGMCGPEDSILGVMSDRIIDRLRLQMPRKFEYAVGNISAQGAIFELNGGKTSVTLVKF